MSDPQAVEEKASADHQIEERGSIGKNSHNEIAAPTDGPMTWPSWLKWVTVLNISFFVFLGIFSIQGTTVMMYPLAAAFQVTPMKAVDIANWAVFSLGCGNLLWMPIALKYGKRLACILSCIMLLMGQIWMTKAKTFESLLGARIFANLGAGCIDSLGPNMIADMFQEKQYGVSMTIYTFFLMGGSNLGSLAGGYMAANTGNWKNFIYLCDALVALNIVLMIFFLPETTYPKNAKAAGVAQDDSSDSDSEGSSDRTPSPVELKTRSFWNDIFFIKHPYVGCQAKGNIFQIFIRPFEFLISIPVMFSVMMMSIGLGYVVIISSTIPLLYMSPPRLWTTKGVSNLELALFLGTLLGGILSGPIADWWSMRMRQKTAHKPEHRLPVLIVPFFLAPTGLIIFACTLNQSSWIGQAAGLTLQGTTISLTWATALAYVVDAYYEYAGEVLVTLSAFKCIVAFGFAYATNDWLASQGAKKMFLEMGGIQYGVFLLTIPMYYWGPQLRKLSLKMIRKF